MEHISGMQSQQEDDTMADASVATFKPAEDSAFVAFWNEVLAPKFIRFKHGRDAASANASASALSFFCRFTNGFT